MNVEASVVPRMPRINEPAPGFHAKSTAGMIQLSDFTEKGKWVMLFSHPADFTPVCTTEFVEFSRRAEDFAKRNVQLIGVSIDSIYSHIAWARTIEQHFKVKIAVMWSFNCRAPPARSKLSDSHAISLGGRPSRVSRF